MRIGAKVVEVKDHPVVRLDLHQEPDGFKFWQTTYGDHAVCEKLHEAGHDGFDKDEQGRLTFEGHRIRPA